MSYDVVFHIGLHKTGTTSFQSSCASNRQLLSAHGILYPTEIEGGSFKNSHADIPFMLAQSRRNEVEEYFKDVARHAAAADARVIAFSSEEFSSLATNNDAFSALDEIAMSIFGAYRTVVTFRSAVDFISSNIRQQMVGGDSSPGMLVNERAILDHFRHYSRTIEAVTRTFRQLTVLDYDDLTKRDELMPALMRACFHKVVDMHFNRMNVGRDRDTLLVSMLLAQLRALSGRILNKHVYASEVETYLQSIIYYGRLGQAVNHDGAAKFAGDYDAFVRSAIGDVCRRFPGQLHEMTKNLPANCRKYLLIGDTLA